MASPMAHQSACLQVLEKTRYENHDRALVVMAPGLGKTFTAAFDAHDFFHKNDIERGKILFLCHQNDILEQGLKTFQEVFGNSYHFGFFNGYKKQFYAKDGLFASFQTIKDSLEFFGRDHFAYIVVDESHHSMASTYRPVVDYFKPKFLLGITATPDRADLLDIREIYGEEVFSLSLEDALADNLLTPVDYRLIVDDLDEGKLLDKTIGKLSIKDLNRKLFVPKRDEEIATIVHQHMLEVENPVTLIFCPSVKYCNHIVNYFEGAVPIHSHLSYKVQRERLQALREGKTKIAVTVDKFNEGIDIPEANLIVFLRSTNSHTVFLQQLGRGLRRYQGKDRVRILDFVANCERLEMVHKLAQRINRFDNESNSGNGSYNGSNIDPVFFNLSSIKFTQVALKILDVLTAIRSGYTKKILISQLQDLAAELGRSPTSKEVDKASRTGICAAISTFTYFFRSFQNALIEAGLEPSRVYKFQEDDLIDQLVSLHSELGRSPTTMDVSVASKKSAFNASVSVFQNTFGGFTQALTKAGLQPGQYFWNTDELFIEFLQGLAKELGRTPFSRDVNDRAKQGLCPYVGAFANRFGSYNESLRKAGLAPNLEFGYTREELLGYLHNVVIKSGVVPSRQEWSELAKTDGYPSTSTYTSIFGSWTKALEEAGLKPRKRSFYPDEELLLYLQLKAQQLGRTPTTVEIDQDCAKGKCAHSVVYNNRFGSYGEAVKAANLRVTRNIGCSREELIAQLKALAGELGRTPSQGDITQASKVGKCASAGVFDRVFGGMIKAHKAAKLKPIYKYYSKKDLLKHLQKLRKQLGRNPTHKDLRKYSKLGKGPSTMPYSKHFDSHEEALREAGLLNDES